MKELLISLVFNLTCKSLERLIETGLFLLHPVYEIQSPWRSLYPIIRHWSDMHRESWANIFWRDVVGQVFRNLSLLIRGRGFNPDGLHILEITVAGHLVHHGKDEQPSVESCSGRAESQVKVRSIWVHRDHGSINGQQCFFWCKCRSEWSFVSDFGAIDCVEVNFTDWFTEWKIKIKSVQKLDTCLRPDRRISLLDFSPQD